MSRRYARQEILPEVGPAGQARLAAAHVLVVGAGGLGATVLPALAGAGVGRLRLIDPDRVSESNLHRQWLYTMADLGRPKVDCAAARLAALNPEVVVEPLALRLDPATAPVMLDGVDLVVDAADSFAVTYTLSDLCNALGVPLISASVLGLSGYVGGFCGAAPSYRAVFPDLPAGAKSCASAGVLGPAVACLGALQAQMALSVLLGLAPSPLGQLLTVDLRSFRIAGLRFDDAAEPETAFPFLAPADLSTDDCVIDLRPAEDAPVHLPGAHRLAPEALAGWAAPGERRIVLCCRSGLRAWNAARALHARGHRALALLATGA